MPQVPFRRLITRATGAIGILVIAAIVAACGSSSSPPVTATSTPAGTPSGASASAPATTNAPAVDAASTTGANATVDARTGPLGSYLVDHTGKTLYYFAADKGDKSECYGTCALGWPVLTVTGQPTAGPGVNAAKLGTTTRVGGASQVTYDGHPLYYFVLDAKPGNIFGQDLPSFGGPWWMVDPATGKPITKAPPAAPTPPPAAAPRALTIQTHTGPVGTYLTDGAGKTVYHFNADQANKSACAGLCAEVWPPVLVNGRPSAGSGINASLLGTIKRADGTTQVSYNHQPLYYFALDGGKPGVTNGQDQRIAGDTWWMIAPSGKTIDKLIAANGPAAPGHGATGGSGGPN